MSDIEQRLREIAASRALVSYALLKRAADEIQRLTAEIRRKSSGLSSIHNEIPTNWLDPLLTGPDKVDLSRCDNSQIEELLRRLKERVRLEAEKWLAPVSDKQPEPQHCPMCDSVMIVHECEDCRERFIDGRQTLAREAARFRNGPGRSRLASKRAKTTA